MNKSMAAHSFMVWRNVIDLFMACISIDRALLDNVWNEDISLRPPISK